METFSPSYRGKAGTWCRPCFNSYARGEPPPDVRHLERVCIQCGQMYTPTQLKAAAAFCSRACSQGNRKTSGREREGHLQRKYGISIADYDRMLEQQSGGCAICGRQPDEQRRYPKYLHVDHCHKTGRIRGLLCDQHNLLLGRFGHNAALLRRAADYLEATASAE